MSQAVGDIVYGPAAALLALILVVLELVVLVIAIRRRRRGGTPLSLTVHAIAGAAAVALPVVIGFSVHAARAMMIGVYGETDPSTKAQALSRGISGQISGIAFATGTCTLVVGLWVVGLVCTVTTPSAEGRARPFPSAILISAGLVPTALGALRWSTGLIRSAAAMAGVPPEDKLAMFEQALDAGRADLTTWAHVSMIAIPILTVLAAVLGVIRDRKPAGEEPTRSPSPRGTLIASAAALLLAALLVHQTRPMAAENTLPWPSSEGLLVVFPNGPPTPALIGPDLPERAPVVEVHRDHIGLDGATVEDLESLEDKLVTLRNNYRLLHPSEDFNGLVLLVADPATPMPRLFSVSKAIRRADYHQLLFAFTRQETLVRPVIGRLDRLYTTCARAGVFYSDWKDKWGDDPDDDAAPWKHGPELRAQDFPDYAAFARRLVELRRQGKPVVVKVERDRR